MKQFLSMVPLEFLKLRGTSLLLAGIITGIGSIALSLYLAVADRTTEYTFLIFTENVISNNMSLFFPFTAALIVGQMMERERVSSALNNIFVIPVSFRKLLSVKIAAGVYVAVSYSVIQWILSVFTCLLLRLPGITASSAFLRLGIMMGMNLCIYIAILPVIVLAAQYANGYMAGVGFSVFYGFCSIFAAGLGLTALYPISAGTVLLRFNGSYTSNEVVNAVLSLSLMLILAIALLITSYNRTEGLSRRL